MATARRIQVPVSVSLDLDGGSLMLNPVNDGRSGVDVQPAHAFGVNPAFSMRNNGGRFQLGGTLSQMMMLDIGYPESAPAAMTLPDVRYFMSPLKTDNRNIVFTIIGAGGTGGYVIRDMLRFLQSLKTKGDPRSFVVNLVDADIVEEKNLIRQNFITSDLGKNKATVLANRYGTAFGIPVTAHEMMIEDRNQLSSMYQSSRDPNNQRSWSNIVIGCVDNHAARRVINSYVSNAQHIYWIDSGNERTSGQVVLGYDRFQANYQGYGEAQMSELLPRMGRESAYALPNVVDMYPEIADPKQDLAGSDTTSCAERAAVEDQNIFINMSAAINILNFVRQVVMSEKIGANCVSFDIRGLSQTTNLTPANLAKYTSRR